MTRESIAVSEIETPRTAPPERTARTRFALIQALRERDFRLVFSGESISLLGDQFNFVALAWLTLQLTGSGVALGTVLMTTAIPRSLFMQVGGAMSDRISPRSLMLSSNALRTVVVAIIAALVYASWPGCRLERLRPCAAA